MSSAALTTRYIALIEQLGEKTLHARGWKRRVAEELGINESTLSKILKGTRVVGIDLAERAIERLDLSSDYFWSSTVGPQDDAAQPVNSHELTALLAKFDNRKATVADVYALAQAVAANPAVLHAQKIAKTRKPKSEATIGALFLEASRLIEMLRKNS